MGSAEVQFLYDSLAPILDGNAVESRVNPPLDSFPDPAAARPERSSSYVELDYISLNPSKPNFSSPRQIVPKPTHAPDTPWFQARSYSTPLVQLHQEILDFCRFISPTEVEKVERSSAVQRVSDCIRSVWPACEAKVFGSYATGLYLPSSDVDMVILGSGCVSALEGLKLLSKALRKRRVGTKLVIIAHARVPIVKFVEPNSGISFDISFDLTNGPEAAVFIQKALACLPPLRPLCMVLKTFLQQRKLNEVIHGGIGSYALLCMLLTHLQLHPSREYLGPLEPNLGVLLLDFFDLYGRTLNVRDVGISCADGGRFYSKLAKRFFNIKKPNLLSVEDPQAQGNDIGKNSYNFPKVRNIFILAHNLLTSPGESSSSGLLNRIIQNDEKFLTRRQGDLACGYFFIRDERQFPDKPLKNRKNKPQRRDNEHSHSHSHPSEHRAAERKRKWDRNTTTDEPETFDRQRVEKRKSKASESPSTSRAPKSKWRKVEDSPSPTRPPARTTYTDHYDHGRAENKRVYTTSASHKKIRYS